MASLRGLLTHSHHVFFFFLRVPCHFLFVAIRPQTVYFLLLLFFFCHSDWAVTAAFVYRKKTSTLHVLTHRHKLSVFQRKTDSVISPLISLFSLATLLLPRTPSPSISSRLPAWGISHASLLSCTPAGPGASSLYSDIHLFIWILVPFSKPHPTPPWNNPHLKCRWPRISNFSYLNQFSPGPK